MMKLHYYGKSNVAFSTDKISILINPNFSNNKENFKNIDQIKADVIVLTKYQEKYFNDAVAIAKLNDSYILATCGLAGKLKEAGIAEDKILLARVGQKIKLALHDEDMIFKFVYSLSNSHIPGGLAMGVIITLDDVKVYHDGCTAYYSDLKLLAEENIDYALITVSENCTKDVRDGIKTVFDIKPKFVVPMNYSEDELKDITEWKEEIIRQDNKIVPVILSANSGILIKK